MVQGQSPTFILRKALQIDLDREVVTAFWQNYVGAIFPFQHLLCAVLEKLVEAPDLNGNKNLGLGFWGRYMESHTIEV
jgi:hypothetical protein